MKRSSYKYFYALCILLLLVMPWSSIAQLSPPDSALTNRKKVNRHDSVPKQEDLLDYARRVFKLNISDIPDSVAIKPGKILLTIFPAVGYTLINGVVGILSTNISFYTGNSQSTNLSTIIANPQYSSHQQIIIPVISNIWLNKNQINLLGDYRFYKYPSYTYGLGGLSSINDVDNIDFSYVKVSQEILKRLGRNLYGGIGYALDYHFNIKDYDAQTDFVDYDDEATSTTSSGILLHLKYDSRKNINNPQDAFFASAIYRSNYTWLGSNQNWQSVELDFRKYIKLSSYPDRVLAFWSWNVFTFGGNAPYLDLPSTGWDTYTNSGRGYIQGRYRGKDMMYFETEYRFGITRNGLLGGVIFANAQVLPEWPGGQFKTVNPGEGVGIRIKLNRYSGTSLAIDYGFGTEGSQGIFFNLGEVF